jgi:type I restriction enzyme M protein
MARKRKADSEKSGPQTLDTEASETPSGDEPVLEETQVIDLVTGQSVRLTEVEKVRQEEERKLLEDFGYPEDLKKDLIRRDLRVKPRTLKPRKFPLVVLRPIPQGAASAAEDRVYILIDIEKTKTKSDDSKKGAECLAEFLKDTPHAEFAVWTNGTDRVVYWKQSTRIKIRSVLVNDVPSYGKGPEDCFAPGKAPLRPARGLSLRQAFQRCHDYIWVTRGGSNEAVFWEFLKIVFAKIQDERNAQQAATEGREHERQFRIFSLEERNEELKAQAVKDRIDRLYAQVRERYPELFASQVDKVELSPSTVSYGVAQLDRFDFLSSSVDVKGEAYEAIVGKNLQGTRGEFFTPRNAVKMGIRMLDPEPGMKCIDPACGTGGFIVVILNYMAEKIRRQMREDGKDPDKADLAKFNHKLKLVSQRIFGLDLNDNLVRVARMNMVMNNDGQGGITHLNSLDRPENWRFPDGSMKVYQENGRLRDVPVAECFRNEIREGTFDIVATNPPFGTRIKIESEPILTQYELARRWVYDDQRGLWTATPTLQAGVSPEILFLERCVKLLKPGSGRLCIVLPDGLLGNPDDEHIRYWLLRNCEVLALVDMPVELFLPKVGMQTHLVFLRRKSSEEMNRESLGGKPADYPIFMAIAKKVGKDRRDNRIYKRDRDGHVLDHFRNVDGQDLHEVWRKSTVLGFVPEVDEHGRMVDDDLPFIARAYHEFLKDKARGKVDYER